jgi:hypothetical protein
MTTYTTRSLQTEIQNALDYLLASDIALLTQPTQVNGARVTWCPFKSSATFLPQRRRTSCLGDYRHWVDEGHFSAMLYDGSLLQITYDVAGGAVVGHRLAYVPCPFDLDIELLQTDPIGDVIDIYAAGGAEAVALQSSLRFDYDPAAAAPGHAAAHLTVNAADCRVPCAAPLRLGHFFDFVFRNFYEPLWDVHPFLDGMSRSDWGGRTVTEDEAARMHVAWRSA